MNRRRTPAAARAEYSVSDGDAVGLVVYLHDRPASAIDEYSRHLVRALCEAGSSAGYVDGGLPAVLARATPPRWILLQYNPFSYGRWGFAPGLVRDAVSVRRRWPHTPLVLTVHETWVAIRDWRSALMGTYQRAQLRALLRTADGVTVVQETLAGELGRPAVHVPVASNIAPIATTPQAACDRLGLQAELVVALFGTANPGRALDHAEAAIAALASRRGPDRLHVLNLGRDTPAIDVPQGVQLSTPGPLDADQLSLRLRASDVLLLPLADGLSTRRTTLMAGLAHSLPVVGLRGVNTDRVLRDHPEAIVLSPVGDLHAFAQATVQLTDDRARLRATGDAGRRLYERNFDWPIVARMMIEALAGADRA